MQNLVKGRRVEEVVEGLLAGDFFLAGVQIKNRRERVQIGGWNPQFDNVPATISETGSRPFIKFCKRRGRLFMEIRKIRIELD